MLSSSTPAPELFPKMEEYAREHGLVGLDITPMCELFSLAYSHANLRGTVYNTLSAMLRYRRQKNAREPQQALPRDWNLVGRLLNEPAPADMDITAFGQMMALKIEFVLNVDVLPQPLSPLVARELIEVGDELGRFTNVPYFQDQDDLSHICALFRLASAFNEDVNAEIKKEACDSANGAIMSTTTRVASVFVRKTASSYLDAALETIGLARMLLYAVEVCGVPLKEIVPSDEHRIALFSPPNARLLSGELLRLMMHLDADEIERHVGRGDFSALSLRMWDSKSKEYRAAAAALMKKVAPEKYHERIDEIENACAWRDRVPTPGSARVALTARGADGLGEKRARVEIGRVEFDRDRMEALTPMLEYVEGFRAMSGAGPESLDDAIAGLDAGTLVALANFESSWDMKAVESETLLRALAFADKYVMTHFAIACEAELLRRYTGPTPDESLRGVEDPRHLRLTAWVAFCAWCRRKHGIAAAAGARGLEDPTLAAALEEHMGLV